MTKQRSLDDVRIASPCDRSWNSLTPEDGRDRFRGCDDCQLRVFNVAAMGRSEARELVGQEGGRCLKLTMGPDGRVVTRETVKAAAWAARAGRWRRLRVLALRAATPLLLLGGWLSSCGKVLPDGEIQTGTAETVESENNLMEIVGDMDIVGQEACEDRVLMGKMRAIPEQEEACPEVDITDPEVLKHLTTLGGMGYVE